MRRTLDSSAIIAYFRNEPGGSIVDALLQDPSIVCYCHAVNLCEIYYDFLRSDDERTARQVIADAKSAGVIERRDLSGDFWRRVARLKSRGRISIADCFCLALAQVTDSELVTADRHEFAPLVPLNLCAITFIR
jgi:PIN domain nuclease of toxin-antitoxin system